MRSPLAVVVALAGCDKFMSGAANRVTGKQVETPKLGTEISQADLAAWDIAIGPDGAGLPAGGATAKQGAALYKEKCASCHGLEGEGKPADRLVGGIGSLTGAEPVKTVGSYWPHATTLFDFVRRAMPLNEPQSLTDTEVYATAAYILFLNGLVGEDDMLDASSLPKVKMPARESFFQVYPGNLK